ncbi:chaperone protein ClpB3, chloroplastic-like [Rosa chinensis]|uniref:chaperone protein ClpB3, chloroplastic-like n=1 Tax=Rosa chinensis TaxID=74649 RepID=UPI000D0873FC|nr:chaperone protein ClpB3, chloroplastic-like [Rosa chinensis]
MVFAFLQQLERVQKRTTDRKMKIQVSDAIVQFLGSLGYDPNYGARPVKRVIQQYVENKLAKGILRGEFKEEDTILVDTEVTAFANGQLPQQKLVFKTHSDVFNVFLQILDDGRVTDSQGRTYILNGDDEVSPKELGYETIKQRVMEPARSIFRPEFINRVDEYIVFHPLDRDQINNIVKIQLQRVQKRIADRKMKIRLAKGILRGVFKEEDTILVDTEVTVFANGQLPQQKLVFKMLETG